MIQNLFDIRRPYEGWRASRILAATEAAAWPNYATSFATATAAAQNPGWNPGNPGTSGVMRGAALGDHGTDATKFALANGKNFIGFLMRDTLLSGPILADHVFPGRLELPYALGYECSVEKADEIEVEGSNFMLLSGTGALTSGTAIDTPCSFTNGVIYAAQGGDTAFLRVSSPPLTPVLAGGLRFRFEVNRG